MDKIKNNIVMENNSSSTVDTTNTNKGKPDNQKIISKDSEEISTLKAELEKLRSENKKLKQENTKLKCANETYSKFIGGW